jgi:hypothetical protein
VIHPIFVSRERLRLYLLAWVPVALLLALLLVFSGGLGWLESVLIAFPLALFYAFISLSAWYVWRGVPASATAVAQMVLALVAAAAISGALWVGVAAGIARGLESAFPAFAGLSERARMHRPLLFAVGELLYLLAGAVHYALLAADRSRQAERRALELQVYAREAELKALRAQIDPHFLFNSLHSISALTGSDPAGARRMALLLGDFLRDSLRMGRQDRIPLAEELRLLEQFLEIERVRFGERLRVTVEADDESRGCAVPPLLLQPLVENAVTHGIAHMIEGGTVSVRAQRKDGRLYVSVENPVDPDRPKRRGAGVGLDNVRRRLDTAFGSQAAAQPAEREGVFRVDLVMPCP